MVSFWLWKKDDASPASFEKALAALAAKIATTQAKLDRSRASSRRIRVLVTIYLSFGYLVYSIVLALVVGWRKMGPWEWTAIAGGPVGLYALRTAVTAVYNLRIESLATTLKDQQDERAKTIQKLKDATKYDSTLQLLEKYGDAEARPGKDKSGKSGAAGGPGKNGFPEPGGSTQRTGAGILPKANPNRTGIQPPATANIRHSPSVAKAGKGGSGSSWEDVTAEFAPNAFGDDEVMPAGVSPLSQVPRMAYSGVDGQGGAVVGMGAPSSAMVAAAAAEPHWYDRILDLLMGEDETAARNRIVLMCSTCRLVNGQAPPGTRSLGELGQWRCMGCGAMNGQEAEAEKIVKSVLQEQQRFQRREDATPVGNELISDDEADELDEGAVEEVEEGGEEEMMKDKSTANNRKKGRK